MSIHYREAGPIEKNECEAILRSLPDWFGIEEGIVWYVADIERMLTFVAMDGEEVAGFLSLNFHYEFTAEVHVMAIRKSHHRRGIGRALVERAARESRVRDCEFLMVKTVGPSSSDEPYRHTREFYLACGFRPLEEIKKLWDERNPCLIMVKSL